MGGEKGVMGVMGGEKGVMGVMGGEKGVMGVKGGTSRNTGWVDKQARVGVPSCRPCLSALTISCALRPACSCTSSSCRPGSSTPPAAAAAAAGMGVSCWSEGRRGGGSAASLPMTTRQDAGSRRAHHPRQHQQEQRQLRLSRHSCIPNGCSQLVRCPQQMPARHDGGRRRRPSSSRGCSSRWRSVPA